MTVLRSRFFRRSRLGLALSGFGVALLVAACSASDDGPSAGTYTVQFPSTAAAVATDTVQLLVFPAPALAADKASFCETLIQGRKRMDPQKPTVVGPVVNVCEMLQGKKPVTVDYGEKAILAIAQRRAVDFMIGCTIQTIGDGNAPLPIDLSLLDVGNPVPDTTCTSVTDFCSQKCPAQ